MGQRKPVAMAFLSRPQRQLHSHGINPTVTSTLRTAAPTAAGLQSVAFPLFKLNKAASSLDLYLGHHRLAQGCDHEEIVNII
jgi:hypothetical protein